MPLPVEPRSSGDPSVAAVNDGLYCWARTTRPWFALFGVKLRHEMDALADAGRWLEREDR